MNVQHIVFHLTYDYDSDVILKYIHENDILFFDDCLYSLYLFINDNIELLNSLNARCIIGFSTKIFRPIDMKPILYADCAEYHNKIHSGDITAYAAYMSISEIKKLLQLKNVLLAAHGAKHLQLNNIIATKMQKYKMFSDDIVEMKADLDKYLFKTDIFVYPYAYDDLLFSDALLKHNGFKYIFAGKNKKRIPIENIIDKNLNSKYCKI